MASEVERLRDENELLRLRVEELEAILLRAHTPTSLRLSTTQGKMLSLLMARPIVARGDFMAALYSLEVDEPPDDSIIHVFVFQLRQKLARHGVGIQSKVGRGAPGWWLTEDDKAKLRDLP